MTLSADDFREEPKEFCESIQLAFTPEYFALAMSSGIAHSLYAITPQHAKRLSQYLAHQIAEYENEHGEIKANWNPNIVSPLKMVKQPPEKS